MHPFGQDPPPFNRPPYPTVRTNSNNLEPDHHSLSSANLYYAPGFPRSTNAPPPPMPIPTFVDSQFIPIQHRRDLFFERPRANTTSTVTRSHTQRPSTAPAPPVPPLPYHYYTNEFGRPSLPIHGHLERHKTTPPPVPPKPMFISPPTVPPKIKVPIPPPSIPSSTRPDVLPPQYSVPHAPSLHASPTNLPSPTHQTDSVKLLSPFQTVLARSISAPTLVPASSAEKLPAKLVIPQQRSKTPDEETDALAKALAISASESAKQDRLRNQEDADLKKALEASMKFADSELYYASDNRSDPFRETDGGTSSNNTFSTSTSIPLSKSPSPPPPPSKLQDRVAESDRTRSSPTPTTEPRNMSDDEPYVRVPVVEVEDVDDAQSTLDVYDQTPDTALPTYLEAVSSPDQAEPPARTPSPLPSPINEISTSPEPTPESPPPSVSYPSTPHITEPTISSRLPSLITTTPNLPEPEPEPRSVDQLHPDTALLSVHALSPIPSPSSSSVSLPIFNPNQERNTNPNQERNEPPTDTLSNTGPVQYLDPESLLGVSIGFMNPMITADLTPMKGVMPNIVALPYGRCPPLHIQAPSWRHLLRLMARLSNTRIEPTIEAVATTKSTLQLRTVVQFVKAPDQSWRTVLWLTIDHPVQPSAVSWKWTNGDVNTLPYSYSLLANLPALLRDGADGSSSKYFTIPSTSSTPWPSLPISFPNYVTYLHAALENSRRSMHDSSSGMRRLAKMIDSFYPEVHRNDDDDDDTERSGVSNLFKRVMGRGNRNKKRMNEETYDLVSPFMPDEW